MEPAGGAASERSAGPPDKIKVADLLGESNVSHRADGGLENYKADSYSETVSETSMPDGKPSSMAQPTMKDGERMTWEQAVAQFKRHNPSHPQGMPESKPSEAQMRYREETARHTASRTQ